MLIHLHKEANTAPKVRATVQASDEVGTVLAERLVCSACVSVPQPAGMVERFNGRIEDVLQSHHVHSGEDLEQTIMRDSRLYSGKLRHSVLRGRTPIYAIKGCQLQRPDLFRKQVHNHTGCGKH